jgi:phosphate transport system protein
MGFDFFKRSPESGVDEVHAMLVQMLRDGRTVYDASMDAVFGGGKSPETRQTVKQTDREINQAQRDVRRTLLMHLAVSGADLPTGLAYMSVVKDAERVGDYAKNVYDLAKYGAEFATTDDRDELVHFRSAVGDLILEAANVFESDDEERARHLLEKADGFLDEYDTRIRATARSDATAFDAVTRALYFYYLKRITAHVMNLMTSLVLPLDQLDYYDEAKDDRGEV